MQSKGNFQKILIWKSPEYNQTKAKINNQINNNKYNNNLIKCEEANT